MKDLYFKFIMLYSYMLYSGNQEEQDNSKNFREELITRMENSETKNNDLISNLFGINLSFLLFLGDVCPDAQEKALQKCYTSLYHTKSIKFDPSSPDFYAREDKLNQYINYFTLLLDSETTSEHVKELAIRLILLVANIRSSGEDYLIAYNYISSRKWKINVHSELSLNPYIKQIEVEEASGQSQPNPMTIEPDGSFSVNYEDSRSIKISNDPHENVDWDSRCFFTFNEDYFYMSTKRKGIFKVGFRDTDYVTAGKIYKFRQLDTSNKLSLAFVNGNLYLREAFGDDLDGLENAKPLEVLDQDTLDFIEDEQTKERIRRTKRKVGEDDLNKPILEQSDLELIQNALENNTHNTYRHVLKSGIFTDGIKLYLPSSHIGPDEDGDEEFRFVEIE